MGLRWKFGFRVQGLGSGLRVQSIGFRVRFSVRIPGLGLGLRV